MDCKTSCLCLLPYQSLLSPIYYLKTTTLLHQHNSRSNMSSVNTILPSVSSAAGAIGTKAAPSLADPTVWSKGVRVLHSGEQSCVIGKHNISTQGGMHEALDSIAEDVDAKSDPNERRRQIEREGATFCMSAHAANGACIGYDYFPKPEGKRPQHQNPTQAPSNSALREQKQNTPKATPVANCAVFSEWTL